MQVVKTVKRIIRWFNETQGNGKDFEYRFTGKDSRMFLHNFMFLIVITHSYADWGRERVICHIIAFICLCLRDCVSLFNRLNISDSEVTQLKSFCDKYYKANCLFFNNNPTTWTLGNIVPAHTEDMKRRYNLGLGLYSMEGREAKHVFIAKYSKNTLYNLRREQIFRHEYVSLLWLRLRGHNISKPPSSDKLPSYIPPRVHEDPLHFCHCGFSKDVTDECCSFCKHPLRTQIELCIDKKCNLFNLK
jgi:hypothetical protein